MFLYSQKLILQAIKPIFSCIFWATIQKLSDSCREYLYGRCLIEASEPKLFVYWCFGDLKFNAWFGPKFPLSSTFVGMTPLELTESTNRIHTQREDLDHILQCSWLIILGSSAEMTTISLKKSCPQRSASMIMNVGLLDPYIY